MYLEHFTELEVKPHHHHFHAKLKEVPMLMDIAGPVAEARQRLDLVDCTVLPSNVHVPQGFVNRATPTTIPYTFEPGPKAGYYLIKMTGEARFVPESREEQSLEPFDDEEDNDFGPDDFKEMGAPTLSVFDVDMQAQQDVCPQQSTSKTSVVMAALQKKAQAKRKERSASLQQPQATVAEQSSSSSQPGAAVQSISAKRAGKLPTAAGTSESSTSEPDYLGLYQIFEDPLSKPTFSSRIGQTAVATSGFVGVAATGTIEMPGEDTGDGEEETDEEESQLLFSALKRSRTRDSTASSKQYTKKTTAMILKQLQKRSKK
ncbi:hypothetical protein HMPREF1544_12312 [Mucor circinelloides 1006PhL]|uniref:Uncharacterized protein n=1 Tax=Mucor circinelloides f. circinelloides (strain 1006PhL) TaxID=1220926 RepID=S2JER8_MUCC1|nr:hypothetical protein HMPREF1544_12312 [Mucor circinelloides 1006PhL]